MSSYVRLSEDLVLGSGALHLKRFHQNAKWSSNLLRSVTVLHEAKAGKMAVVACYHPVKPSICVVHKGTVGPERYVKLGNVITFPKKITIQKIVVEKVLKLFIVVSLKSEFEVFDTTFASIMIIMASWRRTKEKEVESVKSSDKMTKIEDTLKYQFLDIDDAGKILPDDKNLDSDALNFTGIDGPSVLAVYRYMKQFTIGRDTLDKLACRPGLPLDEEVPEILQKETLPDEIVDKFNECMDRLGHFTAVSLDDIGTLSDDYSGTSYPNFFLSTRGEVLVNNLDVETVIDFCVQDGEFEITVSHRGISTDNQVSKTENTEDRELDTRTAIAAESTETDISRVLQSDTVSEHIITNGRTQPQNQDNLVSNTDFPEVESAHTEDGGEESAHTEDGGGESADTEEGVVERADSVTEERDVTEADADGEEEKEETATGLGNSLSRRFQPHVGSTGTEQEVSCVRMRSRT